MTSSCAVSLVEKSPRSTANNVKKDSGVLIALDLGWGRFGFVDK